MTLSLLSSQPSTLAHMTASMGNVLKLFIIPVGGGIPAGVLLARDCGLAWPGRSTRTPRC